MRRLRLLTTLRRAQGDVPAGAEITVDETLAASLLGAIGLVEDLGMAEAEPDDAKPDDAKPQRVKR